MGGSSDEVTGARATLATLRRRVEALPQWLTGTLLLAVVVAGTAGLFFWNRSGPERAARVAEVEDLTSPDDPAGILWEGAATSLTMGPGGWFSVSTRDDEGAAVINARTGERWEPGRFASIPDAMTSDGRTIDESLGDLEVAGPSGGQTTESVDILAAFGDRSLKAGEELRVVGLSTEHVAVTTCLAPSPARLDDEVPGGRQVLAGIRLDSGAVTWTKDLRMGCGEEATLPMRHALPEGSHLPVVTPDDRTEIVAIDTGRTALRLAGAPRGRVIVQAERVIHREGDEVTVHDLTTKKVVVRTRCEGARLSYPGDSSGRLAPQGVAEVRCGGSTRLLADDRFVEVGAPPVGEDQRVPDGQTRVHDRLVMRREGDTLHLRDALTDKALGSIEVPAHFRVGTSAPRGHAVIFFDTRDDDGGWSDTDDRTLDTEVRVVDTRTGRLVVRTAQRMDPGTEVTPEGFVGLQVRLAAVDARPASGEAGRPESSWAWVVATGP